MAHHNSRGRRIDNILAEIGLPPTDIPLNVVQNMEPVRGKLPRCTTTSKCMFPSKSMCDSRIRILLTKGKANTSKIRSYHCPDCGAWHMSSTINRA